MAADLLAEGRARFLDLEGRGKGPEMRAPVPTTLAMMSAAVWSAMR